MIRFSIIMPAYNQAAFIRRAISSLLSQTFPQWELIIVNDGSTDDTERFIREYLEDDRITYLKNEVNRGLGYAINQGLDNAKYDYIAYLPSDDYYYDNHLALLRNEFENSAENVLVYSMAKSEIKDSLSHEIKTTTNGLFDNYSLQLIQTAHKKTPDRWTTRKEWISDDLFDLFWNKLTDKGKFVFINKETCFWSIHPYQHHRLVSENYGGGLNIYRKYYQVKEPVKMKVFQSKFIDEEKLYKEYQTPKVISAEQHPLKILIVGELAYNPERIFAFEENGHKLYGLWMERPSFSFSTVGPLPFGNVTDIPYDNWEKRVTEIQPDIIYATLNFGVVPLAYEVLKKNPGIPFVWHFKEGPFICMQNGTWDKLIELYDKADGKIYINPEIKKWYEQFIPDTGLSFIMDGDLPKMSHFAANFSTRLSETDGDVHTVIPGRVIGLSPQDIKILADNKIHIHLYMENYYESKMLFNEEIRKIAFDYFHLHPHCSADKWVEEFSKYDAGWLHCFDSQNNGNIKYASWDDLNMPARMNTLAAAGLPMIQKKNKQHIVAMKSHVEANNMGVFFDTYEELSVLLKDAANMQNIRENVLKHRRSFCFDDYVRDLIDFFRKVIKTKKDNG
ncbi:MAG: glycosyltransferase family 2 protein [Tannerella sp.]|nr:glycosyltransferase family 2 protein [Tannerella sp.]